MKLSIKALLIAAIMFLSYIPAHTQDEYIDDMEFDEADEIEQPKTYFVLGGGYIGTFMFNDLKDVNDLLPSLGFDTKAEMNTPIFLSGAQGVIGFPFVPNSRVGIFGTSGSVSKKIDIDSDTSRGLDYKISMMGFNFDWAFWMPIKSLAFLVGLNGGWGTISIERYQAVKTSDWNNFGSGTPDGNTLRRAEKSIWFLQPNVYAEYSLGGFLMVRLNVGYTFDLQGSSDWQLNGVTDLKSVPNKITAKALKAEFGLFFGLFNY